MSMWLLVSSLTFSLLHQVVNSQTARIQTCHLWERPVEDITSQEQFFSLIPKRDEDAGDQSTERIHVYLMIYDDACIDDTKNPFFEGIEYKWGPGIVYIAAVHKNIMPDLEKDWNLPSNCSHLLFIPMGARYEDVDQFKVAQSQTWQDLTNFAGEASRADITFINRSGRRLKSFWYHKEEKALGQLGVDENYSTGTFLGHIFLWRDADTNEVVDFYVTKKLRDEYEITEMSTCEEQDLTPGTKECAEAKQREVMDICYDFWAKQREALNWLQPQILKTFTKMGFEKRQMDKDLYNRIYKWYKAHEPFPETTEPEGLAGPVLNQIDSPTYMAHLEEPERQAITNYFKPILEEWSGLPNLYLTSLYGIRKYTNRAYLGMHTDTCTTHVVSAIVNVDQHVNEPWPLQIYDHDGVMHSLTMEPGDMVFYESATNNHARQIEMNGTDYSNFFIHFRPKDKSHWDCDWF